MNFDAYSIMTRWELAAGIAVGVAAVLSIARRVALAALRRSRRADDNEAVGLIRSIHPWFLWVLALAVASRSAPAHFPVLVRDGLFIAVAFQVLTTGSRMVGPVIRHLVGHGKDAENSQSAVQLLDLILRVALWVAVVLLTLENLGVNITTLIAGLGVGGIAVGLALQGIASDLFASLSIMLDKPFEVGDSIEMSSYSGTVEKIGVRTTRIRSATGDEVVLPNTELTSSPVHNYKRMVERRNLFTIGVDYQTPINEIRQIPQMVQRIVEAQANTRFERAHFTDFGASSLDFEVAYYVLSANYQEFMDIQQEINLALLEEFTTRGIAFPFPTQTVYLESSSADQEFGAAGESQEST